MSPEEPMQPQPGPLWRRLLPYAVAVALVVYVILRLDFAAFVTALRSTHHLGFLAFTVAFNIALLAADTLATTQVYRTTVAPVRYVELFAIRGASYLPSAVNHHIGQAWLTYFLARAYAAPLWRVAGATLLVYATTFGALYLFLLMGWVLEPGGFGWLTQAVVLIAVCGFAYLIVVHLKPKALARYTVTAPLVEAGVRGHLVSLAYRFPHVLVQFFGAWIPFFFFGVDIPVSDALKLMPILMFVVVLPISPQGVGTRDAVALSLFASHAGDRPEAIAAATVSWACALTLVQLGLWPVFIRRAQRLMASAASAEPAASGDDRL